MNAYLGHVGKTQMLESSAINDERSRISMLIAIRYVAGLEIDRLK